MHALQIHAGPRALESIRHQGLRPQDIRAVPAAAGGPKGLVLNPLDRYLFAHWLRGRGPSVHLVGASVGAWRMACAMLDEPDAALRRLAVDYVAESYDPPTGERQSAGNISRRFAVLLERHFGGQQAQVLQHPRLRLHVLASRGRRCLRREHRLLMPLGGAAAWVANAVDRRHLGGWLERVVFSDPREPLPLKLEDLPTEEVALEAANLMPAILASGSIPFWLRAVTSIPGAPDGAYWDGGLTDYQFHWPWSRIEANRDGAGLVLYPHFQPSLVPGWLDKPFRQRHRMTPGLDNVIVLSPRADWIARLPGGKLPDRQDFKRYASAPAQRMQAWRAAIQASEQLADEWHEWLQQGCPLDDVQPL
ncbi:hypothetical protein C7444_103107 [Sphaerotilus hippei]|uniref:Patatin-like phospholipase n=1 Tax=Sphaerotilus hippei TaxID=744406 RepID=A0A318H399_9BURK|nr:phospholipase [Sphaerotilus hippei]PXW98016.1 hypothetical protein C7444_103107 [Sphaerotilus hippei]